MLIAIYGADKHFFYFFMSKTAIGIIYYTVGVCSFKKENRRNK